MTNARKKIMMVDDNMVNLTIGKDILKPLYEVYALPSAAKLFEFLGKVRPDLILLDVDMPEMNGFDAIKRLKSDKNLSDIPVIFLTALTDAQNELDGLSLGAIDYVTKPFSAALLLRRIENHLLIEDQKTELRDFGDNLSKMVAQQTQEIFDLQRSVISAVAELVEFRDDVTGEHINRTQKFLHLIVSEVLAENLYPADVKNWNMKFLLQSALMHDVGKIAISDMILNKPGKLTPEEFEIMKTHAQKGIEIIERMETSNGKHDFLKHAKAIAGTHHEKWDGSGYPKGLKGAEIPLEGRIMAIADVYDALISVRPYKKAYTPEEAAKVITDGANTHFDPALIDVFVRLADQFARAAC